MKQELCVVSGCPAVTHCRGLCGKHYKAAQRIIRSTELTWDEIAQSGLCKPAKPQGRPPCPFSRRLIDIAQKLHPPGPASNPSEAAQ
ncbi:hypothetical protein DTL42_18645 [Bremerella cremea]|uniref:Uncharacterized protein n=1 Tax=Bremerella cremea TaxID=1031537 RepID=A0A368KQH9_9BACT|nr:hypothetical protein [Bremerella cremea]RCS44003.1 hypothetical protein DTL42_18645 [Bremerella cremea]